LVASQSFSKRYHGEFNAVVFYSVLPTDSCFYVSGQLLDTIAGSPTTGFLARLDLDGENLEVFPLRIEGSAIFYQENDLQTVGTDTLFTTGVIFDDLGRHVFICGLSPEGDTLFTRYFEQPLYPDEEFIYPTGGTTKMGDGYLVLNNIFNTEFNPSSNDTYLIRLDSSFNEEWDKHFESSVNDFSQSLVIRDDEIIVGSNQNNWNIANNNYTSRLHLMLLDSEGDVQDNFYYPADYSFLMGPADAMIVEDDGSLIIASREGHEEVHSPSWSEIYWQNCILKVNPDLSEVEWLRPLRSGEMLSPFNQFTSLLKTVDNSGYVAAGHGLYNGEVGLGIIAKVSTEGDSLWLRHIQFVYSQTPHHVFNDMIQTPDGGFILVGEATNFSPDTLFPPPFQQGWIVKVDEHGCLVPGCHLYDSTEEPMSDLAIQLQAYPNPASEFLHLFFQRPNSGRENWHFRVFDLLGREHARFETEFPEMSFILDVQQWPTGLYFLEAVGPHGAAGGGGDIGGVRSSVRTLMA
jgi:hypothetical protein